MQIQVVVSVYPPTKQVNFTLVFTTLPFKRMQEMEKGWKCNACLFVFQFSSIFKYTCTCILYFSKPKHTFSAAAVMNSFDWVFQILGIVRTHCMSSLSIFGSTIIRSSTSKRSFLRNHIQWAKTSNARKECP